MPSLRSRILNQTLHRVTRSLDERHSIQEQRTRLDEMARRGIRLPKGVTVRNVQAGTVHAEWIEPVCADTQKIILYLHGGGYCICSMDTHRGLASRLALAGRSIVLLIDYRLAPEFPFPAALEDSIAAYHWLIGQGFSPGNIVIGGDSAGGGLTLATVISLRTAGDPLPLSLFLLSPWTDLTFSGETFRTLTAVDPVLKLNRSPLVDYYTGQHDPAEPLISPLFADLRGLPPTLIQVGANEILLSDSTRLEEKLKANGVEVSIEIWDGMWHVFQVFAPWVPEADLAIRKIGRFIFES